MLIRCCTSILLVFAIAGSSSGLPQATYPSPRPLKTAPRTTASPLSAGSVVNGSYKNSAFGFSCTIPEGWVLRTDEMNSREEESGANSAQSRDRVLVAAFSRPPEARAEDVNASILIAAESSETYPGLKDAVQYLGPVSEVAKGRGFTVSEDPYEYRIGRRVLPRQDFQKDVGTRVMHQSSLVMLALGYAVSFTFIGGTEDEVEQLIQGLEFQGSSRATKRAN
jgi:hypothetical protein